MKTSINVPDWLHQQVCDSDPEISFSEQVRDALLIATPVWRKEAGKSSIERRLKARVRMLEAEAAREAVKLPERRNRPKRVKRPAKRAAPAPDAPRAGRRGSAAPSQTTAGGLSPPAQ